MMINPFSNSFYANKNINLPFFEVPDPEHRIRSTRRRNPAAIDGHPLGRPTLKSKAMTQRVNQNVEIERRREDEKFLEESNFFEPPHVTNRKIDPAKWDANRFHSNKYSKKTSYAEFLNKLTFKPTVAGKSPYSLRTYSPLDSHE